MKLPPQLRTFGVLSPGLKTSPKSHGREALHLPPSDCRPHFPAQTPPKASPARRGHARTWAGTFTASAPRPPQPGRRVPTPPPLPKGAPQPATCRSRVLGRGHGGCPRGRGRGKGRGTHPGSGSRRPPRGGAGAARRPAWCGGSARLRPGAARTAPHHTIPARRLPPARAVREREGGRGPGGEAAPRTGHTDGHTPAPLPGAAPPPAPPRRPLSASPPAPGPLPARRPPSPSALIGLSRRAVPVCSPAGRPPAGRGVCYVPGGSARPRGCPRVVGCGALLPARSRVKTLLLSSCRCQVDLVNHSRNH